MITLQRGAKSVIGNIGTRSVDIETHNVITATRFILFPSKV